MPAFEPGDVVRVPFPYTDRQTEQRRPALVVSRGGVGDGGRLLWLVMITSAANRGWPGDVDFDHRGAGLPAASVARTAKIATIEAVRAEPLGRMPGESWRQIRDRLRETLA